jgi:hypothetical protein
MAKRRGSASGVNKSEEIRKTIESGIDRPKEVQATLAERGIKVSSQMVSTIKSKMFAKSRSPGRRGRRRKGGRVAPTNGAPASNIKSLVRFIRAVHEVGGVTEARKILQEMQR